MAEKNNNKCVKKSRPVQSCLEELKKKRKCNLRKRVGVQW